MSKFLEIGLTNAVLATLLAVAAFVVSKTCRRPALTHTLWMLVLLKLITPPLISIPLLGPTTVQEFSTAQVPQASEGDALLAESLPLPEDIEEDASSNLVTANDTPSQDSSAGLSLAWMGGVLEDYGPWVGGVWLGGSICWFVILGIRIIRFQRLLRFGQPAPAALQARANSLAEKLGLPRCPQVWIVPGRISPLLWALGGRVRLILPAELLKQLEPQQQASLLAHELAHARRHDHWVRWLELLATGLYWWHPVAWWSRRELQHAEEQCCDAWVVWTLPNSARAYARALLQTVVFLDARPALPPVASGIGHVYLLKRRLAMIVKKPLSPRLPWAIQLGILGLGLLLLPIAPLRLEANGASAAGITLTADDDPPAKSGSESQLRDLDRRMKDLEQRLDKVIRALERRGTERTSEEAATDQQKKAKEIAKEARDKALKAQKDARELTRAAMEQAMRAKQKALEAARKDQEKAGKDGAKGLQFKFDAQVDMKRMEELHKQIETAVKESVNPERMKALKKLIDESVNQNINPERLKNLEKQIDSAVERSINPQRMEALAKQIESMIARSLNAEQRERAVRTERKQTEDRQRAQSDEQRAKAQQAERTARSAAPSGSSDRRDLEKRLDQLERKMDKILDALDSSRKAPKQ